MRAPIPDETIAIIARSIFREAARYGFQRIDHIRLVNAVMDQCIHGEIRQTATAFENPLPSPQIDHPGGPLSLPVCGKRVKIRQLQIKDDNALLEKWVADLDGREFLTSTATAQAADFRSLANNPQNHIGIVTLPDDTPIGSVAFLDYNPLHRRAELRKLIGEPMARGKGYAKEATLLWIQFGIRNLGLEKIYVSTTEANLRNIKLNQDIGFAIEGLLRNEVWFEGRRHDVLRMGLCPLTPDADFN